MPEFALFFVIDSIAVDEEFGAVGAEDFATKPTMMFPSDDRSEFFLAAKAKSGVAVVYPFFFRTDESSDGVVVDHRTVYSILTINLYDL